MSTQVPPSPSGSLPQGVEPPLLSGLARNATVLFAGRAAGIAAQAVALIVVARRLGPADYGAYGLVSSLTLMASVIADWGLLMVAARALATRPAEGDRILHTCLGLRLLLGLAALVVLVALSFSATDRATVHVAAAVAGLSFLPGAWLSVGQVRAQVDLRLGRVAAALLAGSLVSMVWLLAALAIHPSLVALAANFLAAAVASSVVCIALTPGGLPLRPRLDPELWRPLLRESTPVAVGLIFVTVYFYVDALLLARLSTTRQLGLYDSAYRFVQLAPLVPSVLINSLFAVAARLAVEDRPRLREFVRELISVVALIAGLPVVVLAVAPTDLMTFFYGQAYRDAGPLLAILTGAVVLMMFSGVVGPLLVTLGRERSTARIAGVAAVFNIVANCVLIPLWAARGAALATGLTELLVLGTCTALLRRDLRPRLDAVQLAKVAGAVAAGSAFVALLPGPVVVRLVVATVVYVALLAATGAVGRRQLELTRTETRPARALG